MNNGALRRFISAKKFFSFFFFSSRRRHTRCGRDWSSDVCSSDLPLPEPNTSVRGISASGDVVVVTTDRGIFRASDGGERWTPLVDNLPAHLEAGPLVRDPSEPARLFAGFAVTPYPELWRRAVEGTAAWQRID